MKNIIRFSTGLVVLFLLVAALPGQERISSIIGNVKDEKNEGLPGVTVTATNVIDNGVATTVTAKKKGAYRLLAIAPGLYQVDFELEGYKPQVVSGVRISAGQSILLRVTLKKKE
jgi:hypothetical protein